MSAPPIDTVLVGCGDIGVTEHLPALARDARFRVVAVADADAERAEAAARRFGVPDWLDDGERALELGPAAVVLATPPHVTPALACRALDRGVHVLCEKPLGVTAAAAAAVVTAADRSRAVLQVGFKDRFSPLVRQLRDWVLSGRLGAPLVVRIGSLDEAYDPADAVHTDRIRGFLEHGAPVMHEGSHAADLLGWLLGAPERVTAVAHRSRPEFPAPNYHAAAVEYADGSLAKLEVGWWFPHVWPGQMEFYGPGGAVALSRPVGTVRFHDGREEEVVHSDEDWQTVCFRGQYDAFARAIAGEPLRAADARAGLDAVRLTAAVVRAAETRSAVAPAEVG